MSSADPTITELLMAAERGDQSALESCFPLVYEELRQLARRQRRAWSGDLTLNTTALVHEAYLKLVDQQRVGATSRAHFLAVASTAMRHILCNYARDRQRKKRGGNAHHVSLDDVEVSGAPDFSDEDTETLAALDTALHGLSALSKRQAAVVDCRFFGGLTVDETAAALDISAATVKREWTFARAWLFREMHVQLGND